MISSIYYTLDLLYYTFDSYYLLLVTGILGYVIGLIVNMNTKVDYTYNKWDFRNPYFCKKFHNSTYMFIFLTTVGAINNNIFVDYPITIYTPVLEKISPLGRDKAYKLFIHPKDYPSKTVKVSYDFWKKINEYDNIKVVIQRNILTYDTITKISRE